VKQAVSEGVDIEAQTVTLDGTVYRIAIAGDGATRIVSRADDNVEVGSFDVFPNEHGVPNAWGSGQGMPIINMWLAACRARGVEP
jgi:hypothetical protein